MLLLKKMYNSFELYYLRKSNFGCKQKLILNILYIINKQLELHLNILLLMILVYLYLLAFHEKGLILFLYRQKEDCIGFIFITSVLVAIFPNISLLLPITYYCYISITISKTLIIYIDCSFYITFYRSF